MATEIGREGPLELRPWPPAGLSNRARPFVKANRTALLDGLQAISVQFGLMQPSRADRRRLGGYGEAGRMETQGRCHGADIGSGWPGFDGPAAIPTDWRHLYWERLIADAFMRPFRYGSLVICSRTA